MYKPRVNFSSLGFVISCGFSTSLQLNQFPDSGCDYSSWPTAWETQVQNRGLPCTKIAKDPEYQTQHINPGVLNLKDMAVSIFVVMQYCMSGVCTMAMLENLLAIAVFAGTKKLRIKYYAFVFNLALADLIFSVCAIPYPWLNSSNILDGILTGTYIVSILTILSVAVNRYLALALMPPARYDSLVTVYRLIMICIFFWCSSFAYGLVIYNAVPQWVLRGVQYFGGSLAGYIVWLITALVYYLAFRKIKQYAPPLASTPDISANEERDQTRVQQTRRLLITFVLILVVSFISWAPTFALRIVTFFDESLWQNKTFLAWLWGSYFLYTFSTLINPLIYWWRLDGFREGFYAMFCRCVIKAKPNETEADLSIVNTETGL